MKQAPTLYLKVNFKLMSNPKKIHTSESSQLTRILIVNDSPMVTAVIQAIIETEPQYQVVSTVVDGLQACEYCQHHHTDLVIMDIHMPKMDGVGATRKILQHKPNTRILISTATVRTNMSYIFSALNAGAIDYIRSPSLPFKPGASVSNEQLRTSGKTLLNKLQCLRALPLPKQERSIHTTKVKRTLKTRLTTVTTKVIVIGCSTGGPSALVEVLGKLVSMPTCPIIICQHIEPGFSGDFAAWLEVETGIPAHLAQSRQNIEAGNLYIVPAGRNLSVTASGRIEVLQPPPEQIFTPNIDFTFSKFAPHFKHDLLAIVLSGMGADGAVGAKDVIANNGMVLTQDSSTALIDSMPVSTRKAINTQHSYLPNQMSNMMESWMRKASPTLQSTSKVQRGEH